MVSNSFDAVRLDYVPLDRLMTGTGAGAIDFDWLMEQVTVADIVFDATEDDTPEDTINAPTICFNSKALKAAEQFLVLRYILQEQVNLHKTTLSIEAMIAKLPGWGAEVAAKIPDKAPVLTGRAPNHVLLRFFAPGVETVDDFLALDDLTT